MESILNNLVPVACAVVTLVTSLYFYSCYNLKYWERRGVQQLPNTHWFFGNFQDALLFRFAPGWFLKKLYHQSNDDAPFFGFYVLHKACLQLKDISIIKQIFIKDFAQFPDRYFSGKREKDSIGMRNLFGLRNPQWKFLRTKITPTLNLEKLKKMLPLMLDNGKVMMDHLNRLESDEKGSKHIDGQELNSKYATDIIANVGLGISLDTFNNPHTEFAKTTEQFFHGNKRLRAMMTVFFLPKLVDLLGPYIYYDMSYFKKPFWESVALREKSGITRGDYIDSILKLKNGQQDPRYKFEGDFLFDQAGQFFSGFESGSLGATFTLMEIAKNLKVQSKARDEVRKAIAEQGWTYEAFKEMQYLEQCVLEGLRLYPPVPFLDRRVAQDYKIPGTETVLERGTAVYVSISALHRDPKNFTNPDEFDPDRFAKGAPKYDAFMPFGIGPKICVGPKLGILHIKVVLALLLNEYEITYKEDGLQNLLDPRATFTLADNGLKMELKKLTA